MHAHDTELLDLVDDDDVVVGQIVRSEVDFDHVRNIRAVNAFIKNDRGQL